MSELIALPEHLRRTYVAVSSKSECSAFEMSNLTLGLSRLEMYLAVIKVLENGDSITLKQIASKAGFNLGLSRENMHFLVKLELVNEKTLGNITVYSITEKGRNVSKYFQLEKIMLPSRYFMREK